MIQVVQTGLLGTNQSAPLKLKILVDKNIIQLKIKTSKNNTV